MFYAQVVIEITTLLHATVLIIILITDLLIVPNVPINALHVPLTLQIVQPAMVLIVIPTLLLVIVPLVIMTMVVMLIVLYAQ